MRGVVVSGVDGSGGVLSVGVCVTVSVGVKWGGGV